MSITFFHAPTRKVCRFTYFLSFSCKVPLVILPEESNAMGAGAQLSVTDMRRAMRHPVDQPVIGEHHQLGDVPLHISNISAHGFMATGKHSLQRGERIMVRLPVIGRIEVHLIWLTEERSGFQFERIIRMDDFNELIDAMQPNPRLRRAR